VVISNIDGRLEAKLDQSFHRRATALAHFGASFGEYKNARDTSPPEDCATLRPVLTRRTMILSAPGLRALVTSTSIWFGRV
jgi:hypothetical protein